MRKRRALAVGASGCLVLAAGILLTMAYFWKEQKAVRAAWADPVQLKMCFLHADAAGTEEQVTGLLPGESMDWRPAVILEDAASETYIRIRLEFGGILEAPAEESEDEQRERLGRIHELYAGIRFCSGWTREEDGCCYYQEPVAPGSIVPVCEQVTIPENWDNEIAEQLFTIEILAEAICRDDGGP